VGVANEILHKIDFGDFYGQDGFPMEVEGFWRSV
jgi:hypothetical protein